MPSYCMHFLSRSGPVGKHYYEAEGDHEAVTVAGFLYDACSDTCDSYEVWRDLYPVYAPYSTAARPIESMAQLSDRLQKLVARSEELIQASRWAIAKSERLLERMKNFNPRR